MRKKYKIKVTKKLIKQLKPYWKELRQIENKFYDKLYEIEKKMEKITGIKGIEFFQCDGYYAGIGNVNRTMPLIQRDELEK
jgi:hypothetical protein